MQESIWELGAFYMLNIAICDDEVIYTQKIEQYVKTYFEARKIGIHTDCFTDPASLLQSAEKEYDIIFLDVDMPGLDGIHLGQELRKTNRTVILIYISALIQYAIEGYSVHAFQYLLKQDLEQTFPQCMDDVMQQLPAAGSYFIPTDAGGIKILLEDILFFEVENHTILAHTQNQDRSTWAFSGRISGLEKELGHAGFLRIHKSFLVNMRHIVRMERTGILLTNGMCLPYSRQKFADLLQAYILWEAVE